MTSESKDSCPIAIVGAGALFPDAASSGAFWQNILRGKDSIGDIPPGHWRPEDYYDADPSTPDKTYARRGGFISPTIFDPMEWGIPPQILPATDTSQLLSLIVAKQILQDVRSCADFSSQDHSKTSVVLGVTSAQELLTSLTARLQRPVWEKSLREAGIDEEKIDEVCERIASHYVPWQENSFPGLLGNVIAGRISNRLNLGGGNCVVDAACASALGAVALGINELRLGQSDLVITGGVDTFNDIFMYMCFSKTPALSPTGDCRPFSSDADGTILGEGIGMMALKRLADAQRDDDRIYGIVRGVGRSSDGRAAGIYAPDPDGQALALSRAYEEAGYGPESVELLEAHGTGTRAGDRAEFTGLLKSFAKDAVGKSPWCTLGSVKSQIGHTKAAAGAAGMFKLAMALCHRTLPPTIKIDKPNPDLGIDDSPFRLNTRARPWVRAADHPRRGSVSSFGFGGSNYHITIEEYPDGPPARFRTQKHELVLITGATRAAVQRQAREFAAAATKPGYLRWLAWQQINAGRPTDPCRLAVVAKDEDDLSLKLQAFAALQDIPATETGPDVFYGEGEPESCAFIFAGQGSQYTGMGTALACQMPAFMDIWDTAAGIQFDPEHRLADVVFPPTAYTDDEKARQERQLTRTSWAQPAIAVTSAAMLAVLRELGVRAEALAGHSFGEVSALYAAGVISFPDFLAIARKRGELMEEADPDGTMIAVSASPEQTLSAVETIDGITLANDNAPDQVVLSGVRSAVEQAVDRLQEAGIRTIPLNVGAAFHSPSMTAVVPKFGKYLQGFSFRKGAVPVRSNSTTELYPESAGDMRNLLAGQLARPVRFREQILAMYDAGARTFVEIGPSGQLSGLIGRILKTRPHRVIAFDRKGEEDGRSFLRGVSQLLAEGQIRSAAVLWEGYREPENPHDAKPARMPVELTGTNYKKPYPPADGVIRASKPASGARTPKNHPEPRPRRPSGLKEDTTPMTAELESRQNLPPGEPARAAAFPPEPPAADESAAERMQRQMSEAHIAYQEMMAKAHMAYLQATEVGFRSMAGEQTERPAAARQQPELRPPEPIRSPPPAAPPVPAAARAKPEISAEQPVSRPETEASPAKPAATAKALPDMQQLEDSVLDIIAENTGFPRDMVERDMHLEHDLGIDSIKRVEILSVLNERFPELDEGQDEAMAALQTIDEVITHLRQCLAPSTSTSTSTSASPSPAATAASVREKTVEVRQAAAPDRDNLPWQPHKGAGADDALRNDPVELLFDTIVDCTGFPREMLDLDMSIEHDLGIDSIKRVEILSQLSEITGMDPSGGDAAGPAGARTLAELHQMLQEALATKGGGVSTDPKPRRFAPKAMVTPATGLTDSRLYAAKRLVVLDNNNSLARSLMSRLRNQGLNPELSDVVPDDCDGLIMTQGLRRPGDSGQALIMMQKIFAAARRLALNTEEGVFITVSDSGTRRQPPACEVPLTAGLAGLTKSAALEWPAAMVKHIHLERGSRKPGELADHLVTEILQGGDTPEVCLTASGERLTTSTVVAPVGSGKPTLPEGSVLLASGGARGITARCLAALAGRGKIKVALLGRSPLPGDEDPLADMSEDEVKQALLTAASEEGRKLPPREMLQKIRQWRAVQEIRSAIAGLEDTGSEAVYIQCDINDPASVNAAAEQTRKLWGRIDGILHGAGILADGLLRDKSPAAVQRVWEPKVNGLLHLLSATRTDELKLLMAFTSVAGRFGNAGQADYAMANETVAALLLQEAARRPGCQVKAMGWGPWEGGMVTPQLERHFKAAGVHVMSVDEGTGLFLDELREDSPGVDLTFGADRPLSPAGTVRERRWRIPDPGQSPWLRDHQVRGTGVVPVARVIAWLHSLAATMLPARDGIRLRHRGEEAQAEEEQSSAHSPWP